MINPLEHLQTKVAGSTQQAVAREIGISGQYLSDILKERRGIPERVLDYLGLERCIIYRRKPK